jgi:CheY-like chemotaxis protein
MDMNDSPRAKVLLVEDDENDVLFFTRAMRAAGADIELEVARDGEAAIQLLSKKTPQSLPDRIVLDLKLPRRSGVEVLSWIRATPALRHLSVTIMTSSGEPSDLGRIQNLGIDEYIVKPVSYQSLTEIVAQLCSKWGVAAKT